VEIGHIRVAPDKRVKGFDISRGRTVLFAPVNLDGPGFTELDRNDPRCRVGSEKESVVLERHGPATTRRNEGESSDPVRLSLSSCSCSCSCSPIGIDEITSMSMSKRMRTRTRTKKVVFYRPLI